MAEEEAIDTVEQEAPEPASSGRKRRWAKRIGWALALIIAPLLLAFVFINSPFGKRLIADQIAQVAPASGLRFAVGRIEGDIYSKAVLHDVVLLDPKGPFLTVPEVSLDWRPLHWLTAGLDVRELVARRGTLSRIPELLPGDPDAPILPDFDIRVDRFEIENLTLAPGIVGDDAQRADLVARADVRKGRVLLKADGKFGREDKLALLIDAEPDGDRFDMALDYRAPAGGVIAGLTGASAGYAARVEGDGTWKDWNGGALVQRDGRRFASFKVTNRAGTYGLLGQVAASDALGGVAGRALGGKLSISAEGRLENSTLDGKLRFVGASLAGGGMGAIDLADNRFDDFGLSLRLTDPALFGKDFVLNGAHANVTLDGKFRDLAIDHEIEIAELASGDIRAADLTQRSTASFDGSQWSIPLQMRSARVDTGNDWIDPQLVNGRLEGRLTYSGSRLISDDLRLTFPGLSARLALRGDTENGAYALAGPVNARALTLENIGTADANAKILFKLGQGTAWTLHADVAGRVGKVSNATLANLAGPQIAFKGGVDAGGSSPLAFKAFSLEAEKLTLTLDGKVSEGRTMLSGEGRHTQYGQFTAEAEIDDTGPRAVLVFADPMPSAGLSDVRVALSPSDQGFRIETEGGSMLGPFEGVLGLVSPEQGPTALAVERLQVWKTDISGQLTLADGAARGTLALKGGGLDGTIALLPQDGGQGFGVNLAARNAAFGGETRIALGRADIDLTGLLNDGASRIEGTLDAEGLSYGRLFVGRMAAQANVVDGQGNISARIAGQRGSRFNLQLDGDFARDRMALIARGDFAGRRIRMPRRAVLTRQEDGGWQLSRSQIRYGRGRAVAEGRFGGGATALDLGLVSMPLSLLDVGGADLGLGGTASGTIEYRDAAGVPPSGSARLKVDGLSRSGLVLTSRPLDLSLVADLGQNRMQARAILDDEGTRLGRIQASITGLPEHGTLVDRLQAGTLFAQLRYQGGADALWRLLAIETFDLTGPVELAADVRGTLLEPRVRGSVASESLRLQSSLSGTDLREITVRGNFDGSLLRLQSFEGTAPNDGKVRGSGTIDLSGIEAGSGPGLDLRAAASNARLIEANGLSATVTGPLRIVSNGVGGTIAGRLQVNQARWTLGSAAEAASLPDIATREINLPADIAPVSRRTGSWRYLIDARARRGIDVDGMGLNSEWRGDIILRGTTDDPRMGGSAEVVRGDYTFAGTRFDLTRGKIDFDENVPIDPQLDILAETTKDSLTVSVSVTGNALEPQITFSSEPALPEEEILSRLLFGGSITSLSATDALQLGSALASLRGGSGMDPINQLRSAIGLDRLRIVEADPALGRATGVALGKNVGRKFYVELVTDGRGYSATELEFRITSWLALLGSVSTIGRNSVTVQVRRDY